MNEMIVKEQEMIAELRANEAMRAYLRSGDLSTLPDAEQDKILIKMCAHYGLDPVLRPFCIIPTGGKKVWYATKTAAEMVAARDELSRKITNKNLDRELMIYEVTAEVTDGRRVEQSTAIVTVGEFTRDKSGQIARQLMTGEALANAMMKAETKAKRRATLAWFGMPDAGGDDIEINNAPITVEVKPEQIEEAPTTRRTRRSRADIEAKTLTEETQHEAQAEVPPAPQVSFKEQVAAAQNLGQAIAQQVMVEDKTSALEGLVYYSRENDVHKSHMKSALEKCCGVDWKNPDHVRAATETSKAAHGVAPIMQGAVFLSGEFQVWVSKEFSKHVNKKEEILF